MQSELLHVLAGKQMQMVSRVCGLVSLLLAAAAAAVAAAAVVTDVRRARAPLLVLAKCCVWPSETNILLAP